MPYFVVHEHHSKRLHFDFRLEMDGVLKSWAIPKGPSMSPQDKRLAIMVDDHLIEYGTFEGIIPDGEYGAGPVVIWDSGEYDLLSGSVGKGPIEFTLHGKKLKGTFVLLKLKKKETEWLLIKKKDDFAVTSYKIKAALTDARLKTLKVKTPPCQTQ
jgi:bifunctional non-homologous end joining protein LigD